MIRVSRGAAVLVVILSFGHRGALLSAGQAAAGAGSPLSMAVGCQTTADGAILRVQLQNRTDRDTSVVLGRRVGADQTQVLDSLVVMTIRALTGANEDFAYVNPKHAVLTGRAEPWIVSIRGGATYEFDAAVQFFMSRLTYALLEPSAVAGTRLIFEARPARPAATAQPARESIAVWTGQLEAPIAGCE